MCNYNRDNKLLPTWTVEITMSITAFSLSLSDTICEKLKVRVQPFQRLKLNRVTVRLSRQLGYGRRQPVTAVHSQYCIYTGASLRKPTHEGNDRSPLQRGCRSASAEHVLRHRLGGTSTLAVAQRRGRASKLRQEAPPGERPRYFSMQPCPSTLYGAHSGRRREAIKEKKKHYSSMGIK